MKGAVSRWIVAEADREGQSLVLDAANDRLVKYYRAFGFRATGQPTPMPYGERVTRMVAAARRPAAGALAEKPRHQLLWLGRLQMRQARSRPRFARLEGSQVARPPRQRHWAICRTVRSVNSFLRGPPPRPRQAH